jgi:hypothetical protein
MKNTDQTSGLWEKAGCALLPSRSCSQLFAAWAVTVFLSFFLSSQNLLPSQFSPIKCTPAGRSLAGRRCSLSYKCSAVDFTPPKCIHKVVRMAIKRATAAHVLCTPPISDDDDAPRLLHIKTRINERPPFKLGVEWKRSRDRVGAENMAK